MRRYGAFRLQQYKNYNMFAKYMWSILKNMWMNQACEWLSIESCKCFTCKQQKNKTIWAQIQNENYQTKSHQYNHVTAQ